MGALPRYGQEWQLWDSLGDLDEAECFEMLEYDVKKRYPGATVLLKRSVHSESDKHWMLDCEARRPHLHLYLKWEADPDLATEEAPPPRMNT